RLYITRSSWKKPVAAGVAGLALLGGGGYVAQQARESAATQAAAREAAALDSIAAQVGQAQERFKQMSLAPGELEQVNALAAPAHAALQERDAARAQEALAALQALLAYAEKPLTFTIVDRVGVNSGVERNYRGS